MAFNVDIVVKEIGLAVLMTGKDHAISDNSRNASPNKRGGKLIHANFTDTHAYKQTAWFCYEHNVNETS